MTTEYKGKESKTGSFPVNSIELWGLPTKHTFHLR